MFATFGESLITIGFFVFLRTISVTAFAEVGQAAKGTQNSSATFGQEMFTSKMSAQVESALAAISQ
jgi:hypothetical protein